MATAAAAAVSAVAWRLGALDRGGALAATLVGAAVFGFAGVGPALALVFFFVSSSVFSALANGGERSMRGARQVLANGAVAALAALFYRAHAAAELALLGAVATATADTWATELGVRLGRRPRSILTWRPRPRGASGAVSLWGTLAALTGAGTIGLAGWVLEGQFVAGLAVAAGGSFGAVLDSVLGDGLQASYECRVCGRRPEVARHAGCGARARRVSGIPGLDNDVVNWISTGVGAAMAVVAGTVSAP